MAQQTINIGASPNDGTGTPLRTAFQYTNSNFSELYTALGGGSGLPGSSGQVIFNDGGTNLAGDTGLTFNKTTDTLGTGRLTTSGDAIVCSSTGDFYVGTTLSPQFKVERATGAATISGDLTVRSGNKLILNRADNAISSQLFDAGGGAGLTVNNLNGDGFLLKVASNSVYQVGSSYIQTWYDGAGGTRMTLNATGLGIGAAPELKLRVDGPDEAPATSGSSNTNGAFRIGAVGASTNLCVDAGVSTSGGAYGWFQARSRGNYALNYDIVLNPNGGNLLVGKSAASLANAGFRVDPTGEVYTSVAANTNGTSTYAVYSTTDLGYKFYVGLAGTVFATNTTISAISDARLKENVQDIDVGLGAILALKPRKFDWKAGKGKDIKGDRGFIAQEFEQVFPQLVDEWKDEAPEGEAPYKSVRQDLIPVLVKAIQELTARVQTLETR